MSDPHAPSPTEPFVQSVAHFSDLSASSEVAFAHALAIALVRQTRLEILHVGRDDIEDWSQYPGVREILERWGLLERGSDRSAVYDELAVRVSKVYLKGDPIREMLDHVRTERPDLLVFATEGRRGVKAWLEPSKARTVARRSRTMTLFVGAKARPFVALEDGHLSLGRILVPIDRTPDASHAVLAATRAAHMLGDPPVEMTLLHVGDGPLPRHPRPEGERWTWRETLRRGDVVDEILAEAREARSDLIVTATDGRNGVLDAFRGSFTERIVERAPCPVLAVPAPT